MSKGFFNEQNVNGEFDAEIIKLMNEKANAILASGKYDFIQDDIEKTKAIMDEVWNDQAGLASDTHQAEMAALAEQDLRFAAIKVEGKNIARAAEILDKYQAGTLEPADDLFGEAVSPEQQAARALIDLRSAYYRLQVAIAKI